MDSPKKVPLTRTFDFFVWLNKWLNKPCMVTSSSISALLALCAGNSPVTGEFPSKRPVTWSLDVLFDLRLNKRLSRQSWVWWFDTPSCYLWRHSNVNSSFDVVTSLPLVGSCDQIVAMPTTQFWRLSVKYPYRSMSVDNIRQKNQTANVFYGIYCMRLIIW